MNEKNHEPMDHRSVSSLADLAMLMNRGRSQQLEDRQQQPGSSSSSGPVFTPVEHDMFRLALRREPQKAKQLFREQAATIISAINRVRAAPSDHRAAALATEIQRFRAQGGMLNEAIEKVPLQRVDHLIDFLEQRATGLLLLVDEDDRLDQLEQMIRGTDADDQLNVQTPAPPNQDVPYQTAEPVDEDYPSSSVESEDD